MARGNEFFHPKTKEQIQEEALLQLAVLAVVLVAPALVGAAGGAGAGAAGGEFQHCLRFETGEMAFLETTISTGKGEPIPVGYAVEQRIKSPNGGLIERRASAAADPDVIGIVLIRSLSDCTRTLELQPR